MAGHGDRDTGIGQRRRTVRADSYYARGPLGSGPVAVTQGLLSKAPVPGCVHAPDECLNLRDRGQRFRWCGRCRSMGVQNQYGNWQWAHGYQQFMDILEAIDG